MAEISSLNVSGTGRLVSHGQTVFLYGYQNGARLYRTTDHGTTWEDISAGLPGELASIYSYNGMLYAVCLGTVSTSTDLGQTWTPLSSVTVTGNGALIGLTADGGTLYAFSNRKSVFKSTNNGTSWTEYLINDPGSFVMVDFCAVGNRFVATVTGSSSQNGAWISEDGGTTWTLRNPPTAATNVYAHNNIVYGLTFGRGVYRMESGSSSWTASNNGVPDNGSLVIPYAVTSRGSELYVYYIQLVSNRTGVLVSTTNGQSWAHLDTTGFPPANATGSNRRLAANGSYLFFYNYATTAAGGVYRTPLSPTSVELTERTGTPDEFVLYQNYPNPFNPATRIPFSVRNSGFVNLKLYDLLGREVATLVNQELKPGSYEVTWDATGMAGGMYTAVLRSGGVLRSIRMMFTK